MTHLNQTDRRLLRLNVGFLLKEGAGYSRDVVFDFPGQLHADDVLISQLNGTLRLTRTPQGILVQGILHAQTPVECVRCLTPFDFGYEVEFSELFVPEALIEKESDVPETYRISEGGFIDLTPILREEGILAIPIQALCLPGCKGLCVECGQNLNEASCDCARTHIDPRLAPLRALLDEPED